MDSGANISKVATELERQGFYVFHDVLERDQVEKAHREIVDWLETDVRERKAQGSTEPWHIGSAGTSILTNPTHILLDAYAKSPVLDQLVEKVLSDPFTGGVLKKLAGANIKFRGYNVQRMTGSPDPRPSIGVAANPHEWHRDSPGEFGIALFLEDVPGPDNGATSLVPGSHYFPYCPRWNCLFGPTYQIKQGRLGLSWFLRLNLANRLLGQRVARNATGAYGKQGDVYFFINDVWHGREPNIHGRSGLKVMIGAFAADDSFPDTVVPPDEATLAKLPPRLRQAAGQHYPEYSPDKDSILKRLRVRQSQTTPELIFSLARMERKLADVVSSMVDAPLLLLRSIFEPAVRRGRKAMNIISRRA